MAHIPLNGDQTQGPACFAWTDNLLRPLLIAGVIVCFINTLAEAVRFFCPFWRGSYLVFATLLVTGEALYAHRTLTRRDRPGGSRLRYRLTEWGMLLLVLRLISFAEEPTIELQAIRQDPLTLAMSLNYYMHLIFGAVAWLAATDTAADFEALRHPETAHWRRTPPMDSVRSRFIQGGVLITLVSAAIHWLAKASSQGTVISVLMYFVLGLLLLSQAQLTRLLAGWRAGSVPVAPQLAVQWTRYGITIVVLVALVAFWLPVGLSLDIWDLVAGAVYCVAVLLTFLMLFVTLPLAWLLSLLGLETPTFVPSQPRIPDSHESVAAPPPWLEMLRLALLAILGTAIAAYVLKSYLSDNPELLQSLRGARPIRLILSFLRQLWAQLLGLARMGFEMLPTTFALPWRGPGTPASVTSQWRWLHLGRLTPRQRIVYAYLNVLKRAEKQGIIRRACQTPYEYEPQLQRAASGAEARVSALTQTFVQARYSCAPCNDEQATVARQQSAHIQRELRRRGRGSQPQL
jgi:hypothetical protein